MGVLGSGAWGTALAQSLRRAGRDVTLWAYEPETVERNQYPSHQSAFICPAFPLDPAIRGDRQQRPVLAQAELYSAGRALAVHPGCCPATRAPFGARQRPWRSAPRASRKKRARLMSEAVGRGTSRHAWLAVLLGPSFAGEVARDLPVALTLACEQRGTWRRDALTRALRARCVPRLLDGRHRGRANRRRAEKCAGDRRRDCRRPPEWAPALMRR